MSTHWELECIDCGAGTDWGQSASTNHIDYLLVPLCKSGGIQALVAAALAFDNLEGVDEWSVSVHRTWEPHGLNIPLNYTFRGCAGHRIWPRNEYGDWHESAPVDVVESPPMANDRDPRDPSKPVPYCLAANQRSQQKLTVHEIKRRTPPGREHDADVDTDDDSGRVVSDYVGKLEQRIHDMRSAIADVTGENMVGKTDGELRNGMLNYMQRVRLGHLTLEQRDASILPLVVAGEDGKTTEVTICGSISGGADELGRMPRRLSLIRWREDGEELRADYVQREPSEPD